MKKELRHLEDFLRDEHFRRWVLEEGSNPLNIYWRRWLEDNPEKATRFHQAVRILEFLRDASVPWAEERKARTLEQIKRSIGKGQSLGNESIPLYPPQRTLSSGWYKIAVSAVVIFLFAVAIWQLSKTDRPVSQEVVVNDWIIRSSPKGQRSEIHLPDGSTVFLNSETELKYNRTGFALKHRDIFITGEAFFEVQKNADLPFRVHSDAFVTTALGTAFNVRSYAGLPHKIQLASGKVKVDNLDEGRQAVAAITLEPGQEAVWGEDQKLHIRQIAVSNIDAWKNGILIFDKTPFDEAVKALEIWYGTAISIKGMDNRQFMINGRFENEQLDKILESMKFSLGFSYTIDQQRVTIEFN